MDSTLQTQQGKARGIARDRLDEAVDLLVWSGDDSLDLARQACAGPDRITAAACRAFHFCLARGQLTMTHDLAQQILEQQHTLWLALAGQSSTDFQSVLHRDRPTEALQNQRRSSLPSRTFPLAGTTASAEALQDRLKELVVYVSLVFVPACGDRFQLARQAARKLIARACDRRHRAVYGAGSRVIPANTVLDPGELGEDHKRKMRMVILMPLFLSLACHFPEGPGGHGEKHKLQLQRLPAPFPPRFSPCLHVAMGLLGVVAGLWDWLPDAIDAACSTGDFDMVDFFPSPWKKPRDLFPPNG